MPLITKPDFTYVWASGGAIVAPNDTKKQQGWVAEAPAFQYDNWLQNRQDQMLAHINQRGIPAWDGLTNYEAGSLSYVQGSDGKVYKSVAASGPSTTIQDPTTDVTDTYWTIAFADVGAFLTQTQGDTRYLQILNNLSDLNNTTTARTNLGVYSTTEVNNFGINSPRIDVASAATVNLTTSAPNTRNINITGTTTITSFTVAIGQLYFVRFNAALILTNNASIVTNRGASITTASGDTCIIRATAANVVEVLSYVENASANVLQSTNGWQKLPSGLIIQWGVTPPVSLNGTQVVTLPISYPAANLFVSTIANTNSGTASASVSVSVRNLSNFTMYGHAGGSPTYQFLSIGY